MNPLAQLLAMIQAQGQQPAGPPGRRTLPVTMSPNMVSDQSMFSQGDLANASPYLRKMIDAAEKGDPVASTFVAEMWSKLKAMRYNEANPGQPIGKANAGVGVPLPNGETWRLR